MKVYLTGSHATGKSTIARYISEKYKIPLIHEVARTVLAEKELHLNSLRTNIDLVDSYQWEVFERQLKEEEKIKSYVSDRGFDFLAYAAQHSRISNKIFEDERFKNYINNFKNKDFLIFFVRASKATLFQDGIRENPLWEGVLAIDAQIKLILEIFGIKYFQISCDSIQERLNLVDNVLDLFFTSK